MGVNAFSRESGGVKQAVENDKLAVGVALDNCLKVELKVGGLGEAGAVPQQAQLRPIGHHSPKGLRAVEEVLYQGVRSASVRRSSLVQSLIDGDDVDRRGVLPGMGEVGNRECRATRFY